MAKDILFISDTMIKERTAIHGNIDPKLIYPSIKIAQDMYLQPLLGSVMYRKLQTLIVNDSISIEANAAYKTLLDDYIVDTMLYYTLKELATDISFQFWNKGVVRNGGDNTESVSMNELIDLQNNYKNRAEFYGNRLRLYILATRNESPQTFPEYLQGVSRVDDINPNNKAFTMPVYLGGEGGCCEGFTDQTINLL